VFLTSDPDVARAFCHNYAAVRGFFLSVELQNGVKLEERKEAVDDIAEAAAVYFQRCRNARF